MKAQYFLFIFLLFFGVTQAQEKLSKEEEARREKNVQAGNPFIKYGSKAPVATLSKGKYLEVHDLDSIVTIGTMRWHVDKEEIVGRIEQDTLNPDAQPIGDAPGRWMSMDPLSEEFSDWSPYSMCFDNPVKYVDTDGMAPTDIVIFGANNSSVTVQTSLIDVSVNASSLGIDFGGNYSIGGSEVLGAALDIVGIFDPSGVADAINAGISATDGNWGDAIISGIGIIPYAGDLAKLGKVEKDVKIIGNAIDAVKDADKASDLAKAESRAAKLSKTSREGKDFTKAGKESVIDVNKAKNNGKAVCESCGTSTTKATQSKRGVTPSKKETQVDHVKRKREGGSGTPNNGQVLCRGCNIKKG
ncbi:HNH endonuclease [Flavobacterium sp.]|uniref:HNH endonuclease n=1 Tax=Flavobacterium sp. TaxID=239 RepID=UPI003D6BD802